MVRFFAILLLLVSPAFAADSPVNINLSDTGPDFLRISGPTEGEVGQEITLVVRGLPEVDLQQKLIEILKLFENMRLQVSCPGEPIDVDSELGFTVAPVSYRMKILLTPIEVGTHVIAVDWNEPPFGLALHRIEIRGPPPVPPPPPDPPQPPTPTPGTIERVVIVEESGDRTPEQAAILTDSRLKPLRDQRKLLILDQDAADSSGIPASELSQHDGQPLPRVIGLDSSGVRSAAAELPGSADGLMELLKAWGVL